MALISEWLLIFFAILLQAAFLVRALLFSLERNGTRFRTGKKHLHPAWLHAAVLGGACVIILGLDRSDMVLVIGQGAALALLANLPGACWKRPPADD